MEVVHISWSLISRKVLLSLGTTQRVSKQRIGVSLAFDFSLAQ